MELKRSRPGGPYDSLPEVPSFTVTSEDIADGQLLPIAHVHPSAGGSDLSPELSWSGFPEQTRSFAVTCFDPDAPTHSGWWHWLAVNIPVGVTSLERGAGAADGSGMPAGVVQFRTDYGSYGYGGAAPPPGDHDHRYFFAVHALDVDHLDLAPETPAAIVGFNLTAHTIAR
nr:YbhB/YbcL family Raf kinase inhibitor-like protein [Candidatus Nanopelagicales bacterium]